MVPITRRASSFNKMLYFLINNKPILIRSMLAAGIVQDKVVGEAIQGEGGEEEATSTSTSYCYTYNS